MLLSPAWTYSKILSAEPYINIRRSASSTFIPRSAIGNGFSVDVLVSGKQ